MTASGDETEKPASFDSPALFQPVGPASSRRKATLRSKHAQEVSSRVRTREARVQDAKTDPALPGQECASPLASSVKAVRFAPVNAHYAVLTARAAKRRGPPRRAFASFFRAEITLEERKKEGTKCQKDNTLLGENYCKRELAPRGGFEPPKFRLTAEQLISSGLAGVRH